ncbi:MAG: ABC transporter permease [Bifidobacteriaceae bacterium]|jgi:putative ABC transport system permease protein|nr:ABC transporter permease [Bifidobacteriaceae bacterium]
MMRRLAWRAVAAHPARAIGPLVAVVLGIAFLSGTLQLRAGMSQTFQQIMNVANSADAYVRGAEEIGATTRFSLATIPAYAPVPVTLAQTIAGLPGVDATYLDIEGEAVLIGADGTAATLGGAPGLVYGWAAERGFHLSEGSPPQGAGEIVLEQTTAERAGLERGSTARMVVGGDLREVTVVGIADVDAALAGASLAMVDQATALADYAPEGMVPMIGVESSTLSPQDLTAALNQALPAADGAVAVTGETVRGETLDGIEEMFGVVSVFLIAFAALAIGIGGFIVANTFTMSVRQRTGEYALLRAVGASPGQVFGVVVGQAAIIGLFGGALGVVAGMGLVAGLRLLLAAAGLVIDVPTWPTTANALLALAVGVVAATVAAAIPARRAGRIAPVAAIGDHSAEASRPSRVRGAIGGLLAGGGIACLVLSVVHDAGPRSALLACGAVGLLAGTVVAAVNIARPALGWLAWPFSALVRPVGRLARINLWRSPRRAASTAGAAMIGLVVVGAATVAAASFDASARRVVAESYEGDLFVQPVNQEPLPAGAVSAVEALDQVKAVSTVAWTDARAGGEDVLLSGVTAASLASLGIELEAGSWQSVADGDAAVAWPLMDRRGWELGDEVDLATADGQVRAVIGGVMANSMALGDVALNGQDYAGLVDQADRTVHLVSIDGQAGVELAELDRVVSAAVEPYAVVSVMDSDEVMESVSGQVAALTGALFGLLAMSLLIAALGIANTVGLSMVERTREMGLLRAVGLGSGQLAGSVVLEAVLIAAFGALTGLVIGVGVGAALPAVFESQGLTVLVIPWARLGLTFGVACLVGGLAAALPAARASRTPVLAAVAG